MRGKFLLLFVGVVFAIVLLNGRHFITLSENSADDVPIHATIDDEPLKESTPIDETQRVPAHQEEDSNHNTSSSHSELHHWLNARSTSFSSFSEADQKQLKEKLIELQESDLNELRKISSSTKNPINKRILSLYMLGESNAGELALQEFLSKEIELIENAPPHSVDESRNGREKALRVMAIEQLIERSATRQEAKEKLNQIIPTIKDPWLRSFAIRKSEEIL